MVAQYVSAHVREHHELKQQLREVGAVRREVARARQEQRWLLGSLLAGVAVLVLTTCSVGR